MSAYSDLPPKQRRFVDELIADPKSNAGNAARNAGYSQKRPDVAASKLMAQPLVARAIAERQDALGAKAGVSKERVLQELARIAFFDPRKIFDDQHQLKRTVDLGDDEAAVIAGLEVLEEFEGNGQDRVQIGWLKKIKLADKVKALELLAKHLGMFPRETGGNTFNLNAFDARTIPAVAALFERLAAIGAGGGNAPPGAGGPVLLAALRHGQEGRGTSVAPEPDEGRGD